MYCDTAILVKLLTPEPDSGEFEERLQDEPISSSELAFGEVSAALFAKERHGLILPRERTAAWLQFETWVADKTIRLEPLNANVLRRIPLALARCHPSVPLRTLDAIHVVTCDLAADFPLVATDRRLRAAAHHLQIPLFPAHLPNDLF